MADREKVIKGLEYCTTHYNCRNVRSPNCPYLDLCKPIEDATGTTLERDALALLKEQEAIQWINVKDKLPEKDGQYLVVYTFFDCKGMSVIRFTHNLHDIDEYIFGTENRPGWYEPDDEVGYFERTTVTHWAKLPEFPTEGR